MNYKEARYAVEKEIAENKHRVASLLEDGDYLDDDGYPTDVALEIIEKWHWDDIPGWFKFIQDIWHLRSWGWDEGLEPHDYNKDEQVYRYHISTAGWSGNESIISAMKQNDMLWHFTWVQSRRGGHYIFEGRE
jgi:hypothetical protein